MDRRGIAVLSVSPVREDHTALEHMLALPWTLRPTFTLESAVAALEDDLVPVVLVECDVYPAAWKGMLQHVSRFAHPPRLIVTSRLADERLWAEALNLGAYDVLAKPFDGDEVRRVVESAWRDWNKRTAAPERPKRAAASG
ncbi:MAG TPA: hypothetical protein VL240_02895 [Candidatus Binatia bacterium]|nr:hypothetical protein [Candidatus Binatia bacterium]